MYNEMATQVIYQLQQEAKAMANEAVQFLHLTQKQEWNNRAEKEDCKHWFTGAKIQKYRAASWS